MKRIRHYYAALKSSAFFRNILKVAGGTASAQAIALIVSPILTRQYAPEVFGILGVLLAIAGPLGTLITGKYEMAIVLPKQEQDALRLMKVCCVMVPIGSLIALLAIWLLRSRIAVWTDVPLFTAYFWFIPLTMLLTGYLSILNHWIIRKKRFDVLATSSPLSTAGGSLYKIVQGFYAGSLLNMIWGNILIQLIQLGLFLRTLPPRKRAQIEVQPTTEQASTKELLKHYRDFPQYRTPQVFLNALAKSVPGLLFAAYYSPAALGQYWLAQRIIAAPASLISEAVRKVFYQKSAEIANSGKSLYNEVWQKTRILLIVGIPIFIILALLCPLLFGLVFGEEWNEAGLIASWLSLWFFSSFANTPAVSAIPVINLQKQFLIIEIASVCIRIGIVLFTASRYSFITTVAVFSTFGFILNMFIIFFTLYHTKRRVVYR